MQSIQETLMMSYNDFSIPSPSAVFDAARALLEEMFPYCLRHAMIALVMWMVLLVFHDTQPSVIPVHLSCIAIIAIACYYKMPLFDITFGPAIGYVAYAFWCWSDSDDPAPFKTFQSDMWEHAPDEMQWLEGKIGFMFIFFLFINILLAGTLAVKWRNGRSKAHCAWFLGLMPIPAFFAYFNRPVQRKYPPGVAYMEVYSTAYDKCVVGTYYAAAFCTIVLWLIGSHHVDQYYTDSAYRQSFDNSMRDYVNEIKQILVWTLYYPSRCLGACWDGLLACFGIFKACCVRWLLTCTTEGRRVTFNSQSFEDHEAGYDSLQQNMAQGKKALHNSKNEVRELETELQKSAHKNAALTAKLQKANYEARHQRELAVYYSGDSEDLFHELEEQSYAHRRELKLVKARLSRRNFQRIDDLEEMLQNKRQDIENAQRETKRSIAKSERLAQQLIVAQNKIAALESKDVTSKSKSQAFDKAQKLQQRPWQQKLAQTAPRRSGFRKTSTDGAASPVKPSTTTQHHESLSASTTELPTPQQPQSHVEASSPHPEHPIDAPVESANPTNAAQETSSTNEKTEGQHPSVPQPSPEPITQEHPASPVLEDPLRSPIPATITPSDADITTGTSHETLSSHHESHSPQPSLPQMDPEITTQEQHPPSHAVPTPTPEPPINARADTETSTSAVEESSASDHESAEVKQPSSTEVRNTAEPVPEQQSGQPKEASEHHKHASSAQDQPLLPEEDTSNVKEVEQPVGRPQDVPEHHKYAKEAQELSDGAHNLQPSHSDEAAARASAQQHAQSDDMDMSGLGASGAYQDTHINESSGQPFDFNEDFDMDTSSHPIEQSGSIAQPDTQHMSQGGPTFEINQQPSYGDVWSAPAPNQNTQFGNYCGSYGVQQGQPVYDLSQQSTDWQHATAEPMQQTQQQTQTVPEIFAPYTTQYAAGNGQQWQNAPSEEQFSGPQFPQPEQGNSMTAQPVQQTQLHPTTLDEINATVAQMVRDGFDIERFNADFFAQNGPQWQNAPSDQQSSGPPFPQTEQGNNMTAQSVQQTQLQPTNLDHINPTAAEMMHEDFDFGRHNANYFAQHGPAGSQPQYEQGFDVWDNGSAGQMTQQYNNIPEGYAQGVQSWDNNSGGQGPQNDFGGMSEDPYNGLQEQLIYNANTQLWNTDASGQSTQLDYGNMGGCGGSQGNMAYESSNQMTENGYAGPATEQPYILPGLTLLSGEAEQPKPEDSSSQINQETSSKALQVDDAIANLNRARDARSTGFNWPAAPAAPAAPVAPAASDIFAAPSAEAYTSPFEDQQWYKDQNGPKPEVQDRGTRVAKDGTYRILRDPREEPPKMADPTVLANRPIRKLPKGRLGLRPQPSQVDENGWPISAGGNAFESTPDRYDPNNPREPPESMSAVQQSRRVKQEPKTPLKPAKQPAALDPFGPVANLLRTIPNSRPGVIVHPGREGVHAPTPAQRTDSANIDPSLEDASTQNRDLLRLGHVDDDEYAWLEHKEQQERSLAQAPEYAPPPPPPTATQEEIAKELAQLNEAGEAVLPDDSDEGYKEDIDGEFEAGLQAALNQIEMEEQEAEMGG